MPTSEAQAKTDMLSVKGAPVVFFKDPVVIYPHHGTYYSVSVAKIRARITSTQALTESTLTVLSETVSAVTL